MKTEEKIKEAMENLKLHLTRATDPSEISLLQGQYASLDWVLLDESEDEESGGEKQ